jgi:hypothetical protein
MESFSHYILINEESNKIVYRYSINDEVIDHESMLHKKKDDISYSKNIPYEQLYWEKTHLL